MPAKGWERHSGGWGDDVALWKHSTVTCGNESQSCQSHCNGCVSCALACACRMHLTAALHQVFNGRKVESTYNSPGKVQKVEISRDKHRKVE